MNENEPIENDSDERIQEFLSLKKRRQLFGSGIFGSAFLFLGLMWLITSNFIVTAHTLPVVVFLLVLTWGCTAFGIYLIITAPLLKTKDKRKVLSKSIFLVHL